jgi:predicted metal-dependent hydrolase
MTLRVSRTTRSVIVTLPMQTGLDEAGSFLTTHLEWVRQHLGKLPQPVPFVDGAVLPLRGRPHALTFVGRRTGEGVVGIEEFDGVARLVIGGNPENGPRRLLNWLVDQARRDIDARVQHHAQALKQRPRRIVVRDQSSRWGSCSTTGVLSFSWRLVMAPPFILDYVAAHEVAHLAQMNHGPRFWALVRRTAPRTEEARRWLTVYGMDLHRYGAA